MSDWISPRLQMIRIADCKRSADGIEAVIHKGHTEMSIECTEDGRQAFVFIDHMGAVKLRNALDNFINQTGFDKE